VPRAQNGCLVRRDAVVVCSKGSMTTIRLRLYFLPLPKPNQGSIGGKDRILLNTLIRRAGYRVQRSDKAAGGGRQTGFAYHTGLARYDTQIRHNTHCGIRGSRLNKYDLVPSTKVSGLFSGNHVLLLAGRQDMMVSTSSNVNNIPSCL
jgi:hypothetical protein